MLISGEGLLRMVGLFLKQRRHNITLVRPLSAIPFHQRLPLAVECNITLDLPEAHKRGTPVLSADIPQLTKQVLKERNQAEVMARNILLAG
jgi:hypothetical protein